MTTQRPKPNQDASAAHASGDAACQSSPGRGAAARSVGGLAMKLYKLTDKNGRTLGRCQWGEGVTNAAKHPDPDAPLCTDAWIHATTDPLLAVALNAIQGNYGDDALLWEGRGKVGKSDTP